MIPIAEQVADLVTTQANTDQVVDNLILALNALVRRVEVLETTVCQEQTTRLAAEWMKRNQDHAWCGCSPSLGPTCDECRAESEANASKERRVE